jgi:hypothetical protein
MIATADELDAIGRYAADDCGNTWGREHRVVKDYEAECESSGVRPIYNQATLERLANRTAALVSLSGEWDGCEPGWQRRAIEKEFPLLGGHEPESEQEKLACLH